MGQVTHLICANPVGDKYSVARENNIHTVNYEWLIESVNAGIALPEKNFRVGHPLDDPDDDPFKRELKERLKLKKEEVLSQKPSSNFYAQSTQVVPNGSHVADVPNFSNSQQVVHMNHLTQTLGRVHVSHAGSSGHVMQKKQQASQSTKSCSQSFKHLLSKKSSLLDNCGVFLSGFSQDDMIFCKKIVTAADGHVTRQLTDRTTFAIMGPLITEQELNQIKAEIKDKDYSCELITQDWLFVSIETGILEDVKSYAVQMMSHQNVKTQDKKSDDNQPTLGFRVMKRNTSQSSQKSQKTPDRNRLNNSYLSTQHDMMIPDEVLLREYSQPPSREAIPPVDEVIAQFERKKSPETDPNKAMKEIMNESVSDVNGVSPDDANRAPAAGGRNSRLLSDITSPLSISSSSNKSDNNSLNGYDGSCDETMMINRLKKKNVFEQFWTTQPSSGAGSTQSIPTSQLKPSDGNSGPSRTKKAVLNKMIVDRIEFKDRNDIVTDSSLRVVTEDDFIIEQPDVMIEEMTHHHNQPSTSRATRTSNLNTPVAVTTAGRKRKRGKP